MRVPVVPPPHQHLLLLGFQILGILTGVLWYLVVLIYISHNVEYISYAYIICISSLVRCLLRSLVHFLTRLVVFLLLSFKFSLIVLYVNSPQPLWHQGPVSWKTIFPWNRGGGRWGDGSGGNASNGEQWGAADEAFSLAHRSPPAVWPRS